MDITEDFYIDVGRVAIAHEFVLDTNNRCDYSQGRNIYGLTLGLSGEAEYRFSSGKRYMVKAGDIAFLTEKSAYVIAIKDEYRHYTVNFRINEQTSELSHLGDITVLSTTNPKYFKNAFRELSEIWRKKSAGYEMRATAYVYELIASFVSELRAASLDTVVYRRILPAKEYIDANCEKPLTITYLASLCRMSETNFRRAFLAALGETPIRYRDRLLINLAKDYLLSGFYNVSETAEKCGFDDPSYFCRFFKKHTGMSPGEFKTI